MTASPTGYRLRLDPGRAPKILVVKVPHISLVSLLVACTSQSPAGVGRTAHQVRAAIRRPGRFALASVPQRSPQILPDLAHSPVPPTSDLSVAAQTERLHEVPEGELQTDLTRNFGPTLPARWRPAADQPRRWLDSFATAAADGWSVLGPLWHRAQPLIDQEIRRAGTALVRGSLDALLNSLHPRIRYQNGELIVLDNCDSTRSLANRPLVLVPMICGPNGTAISFGLSEVAFIGYPVRGLASPATAFRPPSTGRDQDPLALILGDARAHVLRAVHRPLTIGQLAASLGHGAATASYHCDRLETAGLITRNRRGQSVWISRTPRGDELIDILSS